MIGRPDTIFADVIFLLARAVAELIQRGLDLIGESLGAVLRGPEESVAPGVQKARDVVFERLQFISQLG